jgi:hypothetical protein
MNQNQICDSGEKGIQGVLVSNGVDIVQTDKAGRYRITLNSSGNLFIIKPEEYMTPVNHAELPEFYYLHRIHDSAAKHYPGPSATGPLPGQIDFPLYEHQEGDSFNILLFGDPQPKNITQVDYLARDVIDELVGVEDIAFGVSMGDIVQDDLTLFNPVNQAISRLGLPWYNVMGNHDMNFDVPGDEGSDQAFEAKYGPATYSYNYGKVHFIILDDIIYKGFNPSPSGYEGGFTPDQLTFIRNDLSFVPKEKLIVLMMHIPLFSENWNDKSFRVKDRLALFDLLKDFPHTFSISAHTHIQRHVFFGEKDGWKGAGEHHHYNVGTTCGSWWSGEPDEFGIPHTTMRDGTPNGFATVHFKGNQFVLDYKASRKPASYRMSLYAPHAIRRGEFPTSKLYVNFFMGTEKTKVYARMGLQAEWKEMRKIHWPDPYMTALNVRYDAAPHPLPGSRLSGPSNCEHLWQISIPTNLPEGLNTIEVKVIDLWGRTFFSSTSVRME